MRETEKPMQVVDETQDTWPTGRSPASSTAQRTLNALAHTAQQGASKAEQVCPLGTSTVFVESARDALYESNDGAGVA